MPELATETSETTSAPSAVEAFQAERGIPTMTEAAALAASHLPEQYSPQTILDYTARLRQAVRTGRVTTFGLSSPGHELVEEVMFKTFTELNADFLDQLQLKEADFIQCVQFCVRTTMREMGCVGKKTAQRIRGLETYDPNMSYGFTLVALADMATLQQSHNVRKAYAIVQANNADYVFDLLENAEACKLPKLYRKQVLESHPRHPALAIQRAVDLAETWRTTAEAREMKIPASQRYEAAVLGIEPKEAIDKIEAYMGALAPKGYVTSAMVVHACTSSKKPLEVLTEFTQRADQLLSRRQNGHFQEFTETELAQIAYRSPGKARRMLEKAARGGRRLSIEKYQDHPDFTEGILRLLLKSPNAGERIKQYLEVTRHLRKAEKRLGIQLTGVARRKFALGSRFLTDEELSKEWHIFRLHEEVRSQDPPEWLARLTAEAYPEAQYAYERSAEAIQAARTLLQEGFLQAVVLRYELPAGESPVVDAKTCHYLEMAEPLKIALTPIERRAFAHALGGLEVLFYGEDGAELLEQSYGKDWLRSHAPQIVQKAEEIMGVRTSLKIRSKLPGRRALAPREEVQPRTSRATTGNGPEKAVMPTYLEAVGKTELLEDHEISTLAAVIEAGLLATPALERHLRAKAAGLPLNLRGAESAEQLEEELRELQHEGEKAKLRFIEANTKLVLWHLRQRGLFNRYAEEGLSSDDLIQEGNLGIIHALEKFDYQKDLKFANYALYWVKHYIDRAIENSRRTVRVPNHVWKAWLAADKCRTDFAKSNGRQPTREEWSAMAGIAPDQLKVLEHTVRQSLSLNFKVSNPEGAEYIEMGDMLSDTDHHQPYKHDSITHAEWRDTETKVLPVIEKALRSHHQSHDEVHRSMQIIVWRLGLLDGPALTPQQIGERLGMTAREVSDRFRKEIGRIRRQKEYVNEIADLVNV